MGFLDTFRVSVEAGFSGGRTGHRFWLYVFNLVASWVLLVVAVVWMAVLGEWVTAGAYVLIIVLFMRYWQVDGVWARATDWRAGK